LIMALGMAIVTEAFPDKERGKAIGIIGLFVSVGIITGPTIGGLILNSLTWHWLFFVNVPVGIIGLVLVLLFVPARKPLGNQRFDLGGAVTLFFGLASFLFSLSMIQLYGLGNPLVYVFAGIFVISLLVFLRIEKRVQDPMIDLSMFKSRLFSINLITGSLTYVASAGTILLMPFYLQNILGYDPQKTGLMLVVYPLVMAVVAPLAGAISDRIGSRFITLVGLVIATLGYVSVASLNSQTSMLGYIVRFIPVGLGMGLFTSPNNSAVMGSAPKHRLGVANGLLSLTRVIGQTAGIALLGALWSYRVAAYASGAEMADATQAPILAQVQGLHDASLFVVLIMLTAVGFSAWAWLQHRKMVKEQKEVETEGEGA
jgi:EmrB/QacA subfamily drug resistance transporter